MTQEEESSSEEIDEELIKRKEKFEKDFEKIIKMREETPALVDTQGLSSCIDICNSKDKKLMKFQGLVSLMLSPQTKDNITYETTKKLIEYGLNIDNILKISEKELVELIFKVSFHNVKAKNIKKLAEKLREEYNDDAPETLDEIVKFPGIGRKIGLLYLKECCQKTKGVAVDTHIHKIANRLKWVNNTKDPNKTSIELEKIVDEKYWDEINGILVGFGQEICKSVKPLCDSSCTLTDNCPYYKDVISKKKQKSKKENSEDKKGKSKDKKGKKSAKKKIRKKKIEYESDSSNSD
jgi:endonuclease-3